MEENVPIAIESIEPMVEEVTETATAETITESQGEVFPE